MNKAIAYLPYFWFAVMLSYKDNSIYAQISTEKGGYILSDLQKNKIYTYQYIL